MMIGSCRKQKAARLDAGVQCRQTACGSVLGKKLSRPLLASILALTCLLLASCGATAQVTDDSPYDTRAVITAGSSLTEQSQVVEVRVAFSSPVQDAQDVSDDLKITLNGKAPDSTTILTQAFVERGELVVRLTPSEKAQGPSTGSYFALYDGQLAISAASGDGALAHVFSADDPDICAVLTDSLRFTVPSGVQLQTLQQVSGNASTHTPAQTVVRVTSFAQVRCVTWVGILAQGTYSLNAYGMPDLPATALSDGTFARVHHHYFLRENASTCATAIASVLGQAFGSTVDVSADGDVITCTAKTCTDGEVLDVVLFEGRYACGQ